MRSVVIIYLFFLCGITSYSQSSIDSVVMNYLQNVPGIPTPILQVNKTKGNLSRSTNFFIEATDSVRHQDIIVKSFLFGSSASHARKYFLLQINSKGVVKNKIIDNPNIEDAIMSLLLCMHQWDLSDAEKSVLIRELTYAYR
jgi:hypothetical protein